MSSTCRFNQVDLSWFPRWTCTVHVVSLMRFIAHGQLYRLAAPMENPCIKRWHWSHTGSIGGNCMEYFCYSSSAFNSHSEQLSPVHSLTWQDSWATPLCCMVPASTLQLRATQLLLTVGGGEEGGASVWRDCMCLAASDGLYVPQSMSVKAQTAPPHWGTYQRCKLNSCWWEQVKDLAKSKFSAYWAQIQSRWSQASVLTFDLVSVSGIWPYHFTLVKPKWHLAMTTIIEAKKINKLGLP